MTSLNLDKRQRRAFLVKQRGFNLGLITLSFVTVLILCLLTFFYVLQTNEKTLQGATVSEMEKQVAELKEENKKIKTQIIQVQSINNLPSSENTSDLTQLDRSAIQHVDVINDIVVMKSD